MKNLNKILIVPILLSCSILNLVSADNSDCGIFGKMSFKDSWWSFPIVRESRGTQENILTNYLSVAQQQAIITNPDLDTAILNLKKYCCENQVWDLAGSQTCIDDAPYFNDNALDSPYLFDHLLDIILRRFAGSSSDSEIYTKTDMTTDEKWEAWRKNIDKRATSSKWDVPQTIINQYVSDWTPTPYYDISNKFDWVFQNSDIKLLNYANWSSWPESEKIADIMRNYNLRSLYDKYRNACALSEYFYSLLHVGAPEEGSDRWKIQKRIPRCKAIVQRKVEWENAYLAEIIKMSWNLTLSNNVQSYAKYLRKRENEFLKKMEELKDDWRAVERAVSCIAKKSQK